MSTTEQSTTTEPTETKPKRKALSGNLITVIATALMPLFFMVLLTSTLVGASHKPTPHDMALTIAGPASVTGPILDTVNTKAAQGFDITTTENADEARSRVADREAVGAILIEGTSVTIVKASAGGATASAVVQQVGAQVASQLGTSPKIEDAAPLASGDNTGTVLFFLFVACTVGGFLSVIGPSQVRAKIPTRELLAINAAAAVLIPTISYTVLSFFVGDFGAGFNVLAGVLGIAMLYTFTVGLLASFFHQLIGVGGVFLVMIFAVALNLPSSGGTSPESMLPPFWQFLHHIWFGAGGYEAMRSVLYFGGAMAGTWLIQLLSWTVALLALVLGTAAIKRRRHTPETEHPQLDRDFEAAAGVAATGAVGG